MKPREILALCCAHPLHHRTYLQRPWRVGSNMVASNGHILVALPDDGEALAEEPQARALIGVVTRFCEQWPGGPEWLPISSIQLPENAPCATCEGTGTHHLEDCTACGGEGLLLGGDECHHCHGNGVITLCPGSEGPNVLQVECVDCSGSGRQFQAVAVGDVTFQAHYLAILAKLPGCEISPNGDEGAAFRFDGGRGWLMPVRQGVVTPAREAA